jgi:SAM-dependent methyltransferase
MEDYRTLAYERYVQAVRIDYAKYANAYQRRVARRLCLRSDAICLDIACGYGNFLAFLRSAGINQYLGLDSSRAAVEVARREFGADRVVCADVFEYLKHPPRTFSLISALDFIEHVRKPELFELLRLIVDALEPDGLFLLRTPNANSPFGMAARYNDITHEICFSPGALSDILSRAGLKTIYIWEDTAMPHSPLQLAHWLAWQSVRLSIRVINAAETGSWGDGVFTRNMWALAQK